MFKAETIKKYIMKAYALIATLIALIPNLRVSISTGNRKIGRFLNASLAPILSCLNCAKCMWICYDLKACLFRPTVLFARIKNFLIASKDIDRYFSEIIARIEKRDKSNRGLKGFRWHVGGDIISYEYFTYMIKIAKMFPNWEFWTYTKAYWIVNRYVSEHGNDRHIAIPKNLHIMFSRWQGMAMDNPYQFAEFRCILKDGSSLPKQENEMYCLGNCEICFEQKTGCIGECNCCVNEH